ncbi:MAG: O-antigen polymerase [Ignavibacteria bacterium]|jgi:oligosaccharide repeat unit polymerase
MTLAQIISLVILIVVAVLSFKNRTDIFSPAKVFLAVWSFCIFLAEFKFSDYQHQWSTYSWIVFILGLLAFLLGIFITYTIFANKPLYNINIIRAKIRNVKTEIIKKLFYANVILFLLYIASYTIEVIVEGFIPIFSARPDIARVEFGLFGFHLLVNLQIAVMFLNIEYIILSKGKSIHKIIIWGVFFITFITFTLLLQRFNFFFWGLITLALLYYASRVLKIRNVVIIILIFFGSLWFIKSIRVSTYVTEYHYVISKMKYSKEYAAFTEPYMYISMNLENMTRAVDQLQSYTYSVQSIDWIYALFGLKHWMADYFHINNKKFLNSGYNTFPFHWYYYWDFGLIGVTLLPLLMGLSIGICYYKMRYTAQLKWIVLYSISFGLIAISFFTNPLIMLNFIANIFVLWFIHHFFINAEQLE